MENYPQKFPLTITVKVTGPKNYYIFLDFIVHKSTNVDEQRIEADEFYLKYAKRVHEGTHFEIRLLSNELIKHECNTQRPLLLHIHPSIKNVGEHYICWTGHIPTEEDMFKVLRSWCVGSIYTILNKSDYAPIYYEKGHEDFMIFMEEGFGLKAELPPL